MFQTEIIHFLQSFANPVVTFFMSAITFMGYPLFYIPAIVVIIFGVDFKKGFVLLQLLLVTALLTDLGKNFFALPRPADVDATIMLPDKDYPNKAPFVRQGAVGFWQPLPEHVVEYYRKHPPESYGFPSGHVSTTVAFWIPLALLFPVKWLGTLALLMVFFMPFSRMYLGQHFLADVLGGMLLGGLMVFSFYRVLLQRDKLSRYLAQRSLPRSASPARLLPLVFLLGVPVVLLGLRPLVNAEGSARLLGMNLAFLLVAGQGFFENEGNWRQRAARIVLALLIFLAITLASRHLLALLFAEAAEAVQIAVHIAGSFLFLWGATYASLKLGLFQQSNSRE